MKRYDFIAGSLIFHAVLLAVALLLPPPFPSVKAARENLTYVEVQRISPGHGRSSRRQSRPRGEKPSDTSGITLSTKPSKKALSVRGAETGSAAPGEETAATEKSSTVKHSPATAAAAPAAPAPASKGTAPVKPAAPVKQAKAAPVPPAPPAPAAPAAPAPKASQSAGAPAKAAPPPARPAAQPPAPPPAPAPAAAPQPRFVNPPEPQQPPAQTGTPPAAKEPEPPVVTAARARPAGVKADRDLISFKNLKGWPVPPMVRMKLYAKDADDGTKVPWRAQSDAKWVILSPRAGVAPGTVKVGVDTSRLSLGYYEAKVRVSAGEGTGDEVSVSVMVLPKEKGVYELPHYSWDEYMNGNCKVCHLPENLMPSSDFMVQPEFCMLCHNASGMAKDKIPGAGGHPMLVVAGSGGTKMPTHGTVVSGPKSDRMDSHLKTGKLIVCVTCHNVMEKPGDYGRAWEMASSKDRSTYYLSRGGWENMGYIIPKVYVTDTLMKMPRRLKELGRYLIDAGDYSYDEAEGSVTFKKPLDRNRNVFVTLTDAYLRVTTENSALCYDCHLENTHAGLNCLACHKAHGAPNRMGIRELVRTPDGETRRVNFRGRQGKYSFADGDGPQDGICEVCHPLPGAHMKYAGTDCTRCHSHKNGFGL